jgi:hypothetical protein
MVGGRRVSTGMIRRALAAVLRQFIFGIALAVLVGPYDLFGWLSVSLVIVSLATIPTSQLLFAAFGYIGMLGLGARPAGPETSRAGQGVQESAMPKGRRTALPRPLPDLLPASRKTRRLW